VKALHLVDSLAYAEANCFQHQLLAALHRSGHQVDTVGLDDLTTASGYDRVVCCLKQRTVFRAIDRLAAALGRAPVVVYDQDPWESFRDESPFKGTYQLAAGRLNVVSFAVTTQAWADRIRSIGLPGDFVRMWVLPEYCDRGLPHEARLIEAGFMGTVHPHRRRLFDALRDMGIAVKVAGSGLPYRQYLRSLTGLRVFVHSEDFSFTVDGRPANLSDGLWIKDVEAASQGCFTIRNWGEGSDTYYRGLETVRLYRTPGEVPELLRAITCMDPGERQATIDRTVEFIREANVWHETALRLLAGG